MPPSIFSPQRHLLHLLQLLLAVCLGRSASARADDLADVQRLYHSGQAAVALQRADQSLALNPRDAPMRFIKGVMLTDAKRTMEAIVLFQKLTDDYPDLAEPYNNLAALYAAQGDYAKARATLEQALRMNPGYAIAHENLGDVHAALAAQSYTRALKLDPAGVTVPPKLAIVRELYQRAGAPERDGAAAAAATVSSPSGVPVLPPPSTR